MRKQIFRNAIFIAAVVLLCSLGMIMGVLYGYFDDLQIQQLKDELRIAAVGTELDGADFLSSLDAGDYRITWIAPDGTVLYDTSADASSMENHANRQEFQQALQTGSGSSSRQSSTLLERTAYEAVRLGDGSVLRISMSQRTMLILVVGMLQPVLVVTAIAIILSAVLAHRMSRRIVEPLNELDLEHPLENDVYEEISPLLYRINRQHLQIKSQLQTLQQKTDEIDQITQNMQEGLILLNSEGTILSINPTAKKLFGVDYDCVGKSFLSIDRSPEMRAAVYGSLERGHKTAHVQRDGREYQLDLSRIESDEKVIGAVVLTFDVTESRNAERNRREFSANVSHELKTPLQSIIGSAELLENNLVKPEDVPRFIGHIHKEAARLVNLIEDIIRLSQLDEDVAIPTEEVELLALSGEVAATLQNAAAAKNVTVDISGDPCVVNGVRRLLHEIVYNLCDNAIKYNIPGGKVNIHIKNRTLSVSDTGIGIPPEHIDRVFERFYRVDKSHSKQSGGTGLGLSIVKHAVQYHNAKLDLVSSPGKGTAITIQF